MLIKTTSLTTEPKSIPLAQAAKVARRNRSQVEKAIADDIIDHTFIGASRTTKGLKAVVVNEKWATYLDGLHKLNKTRARYITKGNK